MQLSKHNSLYDVCTWLACLCVARLIAHGSLHYYLCMQEEAVHLLLKYNADFKLKDNDGKTPIDIAKYFPAILAAMHQKQVTTLCAGMRHFHGSRIQEIDLQLCPPGIALCCKCSLLLEEQWVR